MTRPPGERHLSHGTSSAALNLHGQLQVACEVALKKSAETCRWRRQRAKRTAPVQAVPAETGAVMARRLAIGRRRGSGGAQGRRFSREQCQMVHLSR
ncbi:hypothetical protein RR46_11332 [Papilio xuthus]|uniref:Uncharacterized protein n=1 Tax=Papilio xuthus TaxID=66420 RepID=A0A194PS89_PAPXU|nr:hypothetical protein RR46_11332 [Papilio xuthus]